MTLHSYHDSVAEPRVVRESYERRAKSLEDQILTFFRTRRHEVFTREQIEAAFNIGEACASGRLANLKARGLIEFTGEKVMGRANRRINVWRLARPVAAPTVQEALAL